MKNIGCVGIVLCGLLTTATALPQAPAHAPDGSSFERIQSISISPKTGAPFSATVFTEWTRLLEDGTKTTIKNRRTVARDSGGRVFQERRFLNATGDTQQTPLSRLEYYDPSRHEFYGCDPATHVCLVSTVSRPESVASDTRPTVTLPNGVGTIHRESLGQSVIGNLDVVGSREIMTINPGPNGYQQPEPTIKEFWYSPHLDINLIVKRFEPRGGVQNFTIENLNLTEPDPRLFVPPPSYTVVRTSRY